MKTFINAKNLPRKSKAIVFFSSIMVISIIQTISMKSLLRKIDDLKIPESAEPILISTLQESKQTLLRAQQSIGQVQSLEINSSNDNITISEMATEEENGWRAAAAAYADGKGLPLEESDPDDKDEMKLLYQALQVNDYSAQLRLKHYIRSIKLSTPTTAQASGPFSETARAGLELMGEDHVSKKRTIVLSDATVATKNDLMDMPDLPEETADWLNKPDLENSNITTATRDDPRLFIHVGPVKTGSSSIECNLMVNPFLKESSYEYMGKTDNFCSDSTYRRTKPRFFNVPNLVFQYILRGWLGQTSTNEDHNEYVANFKTTFRDRFDKGTHTILSAEEFCGLLELAETDPKKNDTRLQHFADLLNDIPQSITFQVVYRHNYDWAVSFYQFEELYQKSEEAHAHKKGAKSSMTGAAMDSILDRKALFLQKTQPECSSHKIWKFLRERLIPLLHRGSIEVLDYHNPEEPDIARNYICNLPGAHVACNKTRENLHLKRSNPTPVDHLHADRIATAAWENGMYRNASALKNKRPQVRKMVIDHVRNNLNSSFMELPLECLSKHELVRSLDLSLSIGREMLGNNLDAGAMTCKFLRDESKKKFCSVNVTALLTEPSWSNFFRDLDY